MTLEIGKIKFREENGHEYLVLETKPQDIFDASQSIVVLNECTVTFYKECIKKYGSLENLPIRWRLLHNMVIMPVQLKNPVLIKNDAFGTEYETSVIPMFCKYRVDEELIKNGEPSRAITWVPGWSLEERTRWYDNRPVVHIPGAEM